jgi:hypothetical protein
MEKLTEAQRLSQMYDGTRETAARIERLAQELAVRRQRYGEDWEYIFADGSKLDWQGFAHEKETAALAHGQPIGEKR